MATAELLIAAFLLAGGGTAAAAAVAKRNEDSAEIDAARLVSRANQEKARVWVERFMSIGAPVALAQAYARWAGIESSGNPLAKSRLGERGLFQISEQSALKEKPPALTWSEWDAMARPDTPSEFHARIAMRIGDWLWARARRLVKNPGLTPEDIVWYAKLYHQRPTMVRNAKINGPARAAARMLAKKWANDPLKMHYLRAANVVAFGRADLGEPSS